MITLHSAYFFFAALIDLGILLFLKAKGIRNYYVTALLLTFLSMNTFFLLVLIAPEDNRLLLESVLRLYYVGLFLSSGCFISYAIQISNAPRRFSFVGQIENGVWIIALCGSLLCVYTDEILAGYTPINNSITATQGDNFWIVLIHGLFSLLASGGILAKEWLRLPEGRQRQRCMYVLAAYIVHIVCALTVVSLMKFGFEINFATTLPLSSLISISLIVYGEINYKEHAHELIKKVQGEMSDMEKLNDIYTKYTSGTYSFIEATEKFDYLLLAHAYKKHDGNMMKTAEAMGLGRSTLYKKVDKHGLR